MEHQLSSVVYSTSRRRVCSGGCAFFSPEYLAGRKVAGIGTCAKHASGASVQVGTPCLWGPPGSSQRPAELRPVTYLFPTADQRIAS